MIKVEAFQASDGSLHVTEELCAKHERHLKALALMEDMFNPTINPFFIYGEIKLYTDQDVYEFVNKFSEAIKYILEGGK